MVDQRTCWSITTPLSSIIQVPGVLDIVLGVEARANMSRQNPICLARESDCFVLVLNLISDECLV